MTHTHLAAQIAAVPLAALPGVRQALYAAHAAGQVTDTEAEALDAAIETRRTGRVSTGSAPSVALGQALARVSIFPPKRSQQTPNRARSLERRRLISRASP